MLEKIGHFTGHRHRVVGVRLIGPSRRGLRNRVIDVFEPLPMRAALTCAPPMSHPITRSRGMAAPFFVSGPVDIGMHIMRPEPLRVMHGSISVTTGPQTGCRASH
jgi:hypothetical protein